MREAAFPYGAWTQKQSPRSFFDSHAVWKAARSMVTSFVLMPTAARFVAAPSPIEK
jgi:hypothetical protein